MAETTALIYFILKKKKSFNLFMNAFLRMLVSWENHYLIRLKTKVQIRRWFRDRFSVMDKHSTNPWNVQTTKKKKKKMQHLFIKSSNPIEHLTQISSKMYGSIEIYNHNSLDIKNYDSCNVFWAWKYRSNILIQNSKSNFCCEFYFLTFALKHQFYGIYFFHYRDIHVIIWGFKKTQMPFFLYKAAQILSWFCCTENMEVVNEIWNTVLLEELTYLRWELGVIKIFCDGNLNVIKI